MYKEYYTKVLEEINFVLSNVNENEVLSLVEQIIKAKIIVVHGAGRVGMAIRGFGMRLGHLGYNAYSLGDSTVPGIEENDLLIVASGSGETQTVYDIAALGKKNGSHLALITGNKDSRMGKIADTVVVMKAPSKTKAVEGFTSIQPMTTLNEQSLGILFDSIVLILMEKTKETHDTMWARHSNLE